MTNPNISQRKERLKQQIKPVKTISNTIAASNTLKFTRMTTILYFLVQSLLIQFTTSVSQIKNVVTPKVDFSNNQIGTLSFSTFFTTDFDSTTQLKDLIFRIEYPFPLTAPLTVSWIQVTDTCIVSTNLKQTTSVASTIVGDSSGAHFFTLVGANYFKDTQYKLTVKITNTADIPVTLGFTEPVGMSIVSSTDEHYIVYATNFNMAKFYITNNGISDFEFDLTPSYSDPNIATFTRDFFGQADVRIYSQSVARILIKLDNYVFSDDAESTCSTVPNDARNIAALDRNDFYCEFESSDKKGLYFVWKDGLFAPLQTTFRMKFRIRNPNLPGSSNLKVAMMERYSPKILKFKQLTNAFSCGAADFGLNYPKMYLGPNLDTSSNFFPNVTLYTMMTSQNAVVFNSLRFTLKLSIDLPQPNDYYQLQIKIGGTAQTVIPKTFIYHDFPVASGKKNVFITIDPITRDIILNNIGSLSSRLTYNFGLKIAFYGDEAPVFFGSNTLGSMEILDSSGTTVIKKAPPSGVKSSFQLLKPNIWPVRTNEPWPTMLHTKTSTETGNAFFSTGATGIWTTNVDTAPRYGMEKGEDLQFVFKTNIQRSSFAPTNRQSFIEIITHNSITATPTAADWDTANAETNCNVRNNGGTDISGGNIAFCFVESKNRGLFGSEYTRFRISPSTTAFWSNNVNTYHSYVFKGTSITKQTSLAFEDVDAAILDAYINIYEDTYTQDQTVDFSQGLRFSYLDNMIVKNWTQFTNTDIEFMNYLRATNAANQLDGGQIPTFLRVGGTFDNIDTFNANKVVIFYTDFEPLFKDIDNKYEIGCSTSSTASVRCYHHEGIEFINCDPGNAGKRCVNQMMKSRIEILFSTTIISISNFYPVQVLIPVVIPLSAPADMYASVGTAKGHFSTLSAYPQMLSFQRYRIRRPSGYNNNKNTLLFSENETTGATARNHRVVIDAGTAGTVGGLVSRKISISCTGADCTLPAIVPGVDGDFYGITMCSHYNFMSSPSFEVVNDGSEAYEHCAYNLEYQYDNAGTIETKYCFFCPQFNTGTALRENDYKNLKISSEFGLNWPTGTYMGLTGRRAQRGIHSIIDHTLLTNTATKFSAGFINSITSDPATIPHDIAGTAETKNLKLTFKFLTSNPIPVSSWVVFSGSTNFPFAFKDTPTSSYCLIGTPSVKVACTINVISASNFDIQVTTAIPAGNVELVLYGLYSVGTPGTSDISINTYVSNGKSNEFSIDKTGAPLTLAVSQFSFNDIDTLANRQDPEILKMRNLRLTETNQGFRTELLIDFHLPEYKNFHVTDELQIDLGNDASYTTTTGTPKKRVYCEVIDLVTKKYIPQFKTCNAEDLADILIIASDDTYVNAFTVRISSFVVPITPVIADPSTAELRFITDAGYLPAAMEATTEPAWTINPAVVTLTSFMITKELSQVGQRTNIKVQFTTLSTPIAYESRVYLVFPFEYGPSLGSHPVTCYIAGTPLVSLYCTIIGERQLEITGFDPGFAAGDVVNIEIFGVEQPFVADSEDFMIGVDADNSRDIIDETSFFSLTTLATSLSNTIPILEVIRTEYSHSYIRARNNIILEVRSSLDIVGDTSIIVYIDYLDFEYEKFGDVGNCVIQTSETTPSISDNCYREGNRVRIVINAADTLLANTKYTILINNFPTPDFTLCNSKKLDLFVIDNTGVLNFLSTDFFQNSELTTFKKDEDLVYLDFVGLDRTTPIVVKKGIFNVIEVKREDNKRFNDDYTFALADTENGIFSEMPTTNVQKFDSMFGLSSYPIYLSSSINTFTNIIPLTISNTARFQKQLFSVFPSLRVKLSNEKIFLNVPEIIVYGTRGSLPIYIELTSLPLLDVIFDITFDPTDCADCTADIPSITLGQLIRRVKIKVNKATDVVADVTSKIILTPQDPLNTGYGVTTVDIFLKPAASAVGTSTDVTVSQSDPSFYGLNTDILSPLPISFYSITIPSGLYRKFGKQYLIDKYDASDVTDQFYHIAYTVSNKPNNFNFEMIKEELKANYKYKTTLYWDDIDAATNGELEFEFSTQDTAGGVGFLNITFVSSIDDTKKADVVCQLAQILSFPLEK